MSPVATPSTTSAQTTPAARNTHLDSAVRLSHLIMAVCFFIAYFTGENEDLHALHMACGYVLVLTLALRLIWQLVARAPFTPFGPPKRLSMSLNFWRLVGKQSTLQNKLRYGFQALLHLSVIGLMLALPITVGLGYLTENQSFDFKDWHELFANTGLAMVIAHIGAVVVISGLMRKLFAAPMFSLRFGPGHAGIMTIIIAILALGLLIYRLVLMGN